MENADTYREYRAKGYRAVEALRAAKSAAAAAWKRELRGWEFPPRIIWARVSDTLEEVYWRELPDGTKVIVEAFYDYDCDLLEGVCKLHHHPHSGGRREVARHTRNEYVVQRRRDWFSVEFEDTVFDTAGYYHKRGHSKQVAFELAVQQRNKLLSYVNDALEGAVTHVYVKVKIMSPDGSEVESMGCGGIEVNTDEELIAAIEEQYEDALYALTRGQ